MGGGGGGGSYRPSDRPKVDLNNDIGNIDTGGGNGDEGVDCSEISFQTNLGSPDPDVISSLKVDDTLNVRLDTVDGPIVAVHDEGVAGSINHYLYSNLKDCIESGSEFEARVIEITEGNCQVKVSFVK